MLKVLLPNAAECKEFSISELEKEIGIHWFPILQFESLKISQKVLKRSAKAIQKKQFIQKARWLGMYYQKEIAEGYLPNISIRWLGEQWGFGVFAEKEIPAGRFVGEYTGMVRKRKRLADKKNNYCFEYTIGDWRRNPYVIDAEKQGNHTRFINHSDEPNLETFSVFSGEAMHIILITKNIIKSGDELCYDYGDGFWKKRSPAKKLINF